MTQPLDVFQPGTATQHVVGQVQHVIGLMVGQVHLQQAQALVDLIDQAQPGHQPVHRADPAEMLPVVHLADEGVTGVADGRGVGRPRPLVADGALVGSLTGCSAW